jgi:Arc/MetJ-type ribon-helix-helix transcriptional regulator
VEQLDWLVVRCSLDNRAEVIRAAIERLARVEREGQIDERIVEAYLNTPQTPDEVAWSSTHDWSAWNSLDDGDWSGW